MAATDFDLPQLLRPIEPEAFFRDFWEKQPLAVARSAPDYYRGLFALRDVDSIIAFTRPKFTAPDDFKANAPTDRHFIQGFLPDEESSPAAIYPDLAEVRAAFQRGKTVILTAMQHRWPPVAELCRRLEERLGCPVHTNLYMTPPGTQGFDPHYDTHEVFVLQIEGSKHWRFYGSARELPLAEERRTFSRKELPAPTQEAIVHPGDLLYMPRGHVHQAFTSDVLSLHLTVGLKVYRWADLLHQVVDIVSARDVRFRESLPRDLLTGGPAPVDEPLRKLLQTVIENLRGDEAVERLAAAFFRKLSVLPGDSFAVVDVEKIDADTVVERVPGAICREVRLADGRVGLQFPGGLLEGPPKIAAALHFIVQNPRFTVGALPDGLSLDGKLLLVRRLARDRLLTVAIPA